MLWLDIMIVSYSKVVCKNLYFVSVDKVRESTYRMNRVLLRS